LSLGEEHHSAHGTADLDGGSGAVDACAALEYPGPMLGSWQPIALPVENDYSHNPRRLRWIRKPFPTVQKSRRSLVSEISLRYGWPLMLSQAKAAMAAAEREAEGEGWSVAIAIIDGTGHLVMLQKGDDAQCASVASALANAETALNFRRSTDQFQDMVAAGAWRLLSVHGPTAIKGGVPLIAEGDVIGAIGVAGPTADDDGKVALAGVAAITECLHGRQSEKRIADGLGRNDARRRRA
jgi:uncharacterized protein GlcG (DUF336 family)